MKNFKLKRLFSLALIGGLSALSASTVFAAAGDTISNTATLNYNVGGVAQAAATGSVDFVEDNLVNFTIAWVDTPNVNVTAGTAGQMLTFEVTNNGNGSQDFALTAINALIADSFDATAITIVVDDPAGASPGVYDAGDTLTFVDELAVLGVRQVYVFADIPAPATPLAAGSLANITLTAQVHADGNIGVLGAALIDDSGNVDIQTGVGAEQVVFNDDTGGIAPDVAKDGLYAANGIYEIIAANLTVTKTATALWDPVNGNINPKAIPGAYMQYTITVSNDAGASASGDLTSLSDPLVSMDLDLDLLLNDGTTPESGSGVSFRVDTSVTGRTTPVTSYCTAAADADGCDYAANTLAIDYTSLAAMDAEGAIYTAGELKAGESVAITFNAIIQ